jgi:hypothetical protein
MSHFTYMRIELAKRASYDPPDNDVFSATSSGAQRSEMFGNYAHKAQKLIKPALVGGAAAYGASRLLGSAASGGPIRNAAILGTGLYAAHKANQYMNRGQDGQAQ